MRARSDAEEVRLEIGDFGRGMDRESKKTDRPSVAPLGVGIQGMRERVRQLSGTLEIGSPTGNGTVVTAILPISKCRVEAAVASDDAKFSDVKMAVESRVEGAGGWKKRILIADDHDVLRRGIRTMLESDPELEVCGEAVDGKDALEKTLAQAPDLVILDINMPVMNGLDVLAPDCAPPAADQNPGVFRARFQADGGRNSLRGSAQLCCPRPPPASTWCMKCGYF